MPNQIAEEKYVRRGTDSSLTDTDFMLSVPRLAQKRLAKRGFPERYGRVSRRPAEAVEEDEQDDRDKGVDERAGEEAQIEPVFGLR